MLKILNATKKSLHSMLKRLSLFSRVAIYFSKIYFLSCTEATKSTNWYFLLIFAQVNRKCLPIRVRWLRVWSEDEPLKTPYIISLSVKSVRYHVSYIMNGNTQLTNSRKMWPLGSARISEKSLLGLWAKGASGWINLLHFVKKKWLLGGNKSKGNKKLKKKHVIVTVPLIF